MTMPARWRIVPAAAFYLLMVAVAAAQGNEHGNAKDSDALLALRRLMQEQVIPASNVVFEAAAEPPGEAAAWQGLARSAQILLESASGLAEPPPEFSPTPWREYVTGFRSASRSVVAAIGVQDEAALAEAGDVLYQSCETCHQVYLNPASAKN
jgi:hypothetical protein